MIMGMYINRMPDGTELPRIGKAGELLKIDGAKELPIAPRKWEEGIVAVVLNSHPSFDAAAYAYSPEELKHFKKPTGRPVRWLIIPNAKDLAK